MKTFDMESKAGLPLQAMPVERQVCGAAAVSPNSGVEASAWWDTLAQVAKTALPIAAQVASAL